MTKISGLGENFYVDGYNISGDVGQIQNASCPMSPLEVTGIDKSAYERIGGKRDGAIQWESWFNDADGQVHAALSGLPTTNRYVTWAMSTSVGSIACSMRALQIGYDPTLEESGSLHMATSASANGYAMEWGVLGTAGVRTDTEATAGTALNFGAASSFGLQAYLHVFAFTGTDVTIKLQESSNNSGDAYADVTGGAFTEVTSAPFSERIATAVDLTVEQYLKVVTVTTGGFSNLQFAVNIVRNSATPVF